jgi:hypothetical protein
MDKAEFKKQIIQQGQDGAIVMDYFLTTEKLFDEVLEPMLDKFAEQIREEALEEAAKVCKKTGIIEAEPDGEYERGFDDCARDCARAIRNLKGS